MTGKPASVSESFSDSELSSLANQELLGHSLHVDNLIVHATADGMIQSQANAHWGGQTFPLFLVATVKVVNGNQPQLTIVESKTGRLDVPQAQQPVTIHGVQWPLEKKLAGTTDGSRTTNPIRERRRLNAAITGGPKSKTIRTFPTARNPSYATDVAR